MKRPQKPKKIALMISTPGEVSKHYSLVDIDAYNKLLDDIRWVVDNGKYMDPGLVRRFRQTLKELGEI